MKRNVKRIILSLTLTLLMLALPASSAMAADPQVEITVAAVLVAATNSEATWAIGPVIVDQVVYFSVDNTQDDNYSTIDNTGNVPLDIALQGTNFEGGAYDWTLASSAGDQQYSLYANSTNGSSTYDIIEINTGGSNDLVTALPVSYDYVWSMKLTAPTAFNASDAGASKSANVTLVLSNGS